jgi:hypothetical protein
MRSTSFLVLFLLLLILFTTCNRRNRGAVVFNPDGIPSFIVDIDISKDTIIHAPGGSLVQIPAGALDAKGLTNVKLVIKEVLGMSDIVFIQ